MRFYHKLQSLVVSAWISSETQKGSDAVSIMLSPARNALWQRKVHLSGVGDAQGSADPGDDLICSVEGTRVFNLMIQHRNGSADILVYFFFLGRPGANIGSAPNSELPKPEDVVAFSDS